MTTIFYDACVHPFTLPKKIEEIMAYPGKLTQKIAMYLKQQILDTYSQKASIAITGTSPGGDATFQADTFAEDALVEFIKSEGLSIAVYTEDRGLVRFGENNPEGVLIVDPIDGTRPFNAGIPVSMVSVALATYKEHPTFEDITQACLLELSSDRILYTEGTKPPELIIGGQAASRKQYSNDELDTMSWAFEIAGRPMEHVSGLIGELVDASSLKGGCFTFASSAYAISKVVEGTLGAFIDVGGWLLDACLVDDEEAMGLYPYDIAAAWLIARNAGCNITDFYGKPLTSVVLTESGPDNILSCIVTSNLELHKKILAYLQRKAEECLKAGS